MAIGVSIRFAILLHFGGIHLLALNPLTLWQIKN